MTLPNVVFIRHKVTNFRKWKAVFESHSATRVAQGCQGVHILRRADNPKELVVMLTWCDLAKARQFLASDDLRTMLAQMPVSDRAPEVFLLEEVEEVLLSAQDGPPRKNGERPEAPANGAAASPRSGSYVAAGHPPLHSALTDPGWIL